MSSPTAITMVEPPPRQFLIFPNEILEKIFTYALINPKGVIDTKWFHFMVKVGMFSKLLRTSRHFAELAKWIFYQVNEFEFSFPSRFPDYWTAHGVHRGPPLPPSWTFHLLRRIKLQIYLADSWIEPVAEDGVTCDGVPPQEVHFFESTAELSHFCPGARVLRLLTDNMTSLKVLDLHITECFRNPDVQASLNLYRSAGYLVRAAEVKLVISNISRHPDEPTMTTKEWYPELGNAIGL